MYSADQLNLKVAMRNSSVVDIFLNLKLSLDNNFLWTSPRYFDSVDICKYRPEWLETRTQGTLQNHGKEPIKVATVTVFTPTEIEFGLFQQGAR